MTTAISTTSFINSLGVNTHLDFNAYGYQDVSTTEAAINYLGLKNLRDSAQSPNDASLWQQVSAATGARFDDYIGETSPDGMQTDLNLIPQLAQEGILNYIEGGNEEDDSYPLSLGNNQYIAAQFQPQLAQLGHQLGLPVINLSFGAGWTAANNWQGNYGTVGDLSAFTDYANAHSYPMMGQTVDSVTTRMNGLANLAAGSRPVITTEIGWDLNLGFSQQQVATAALDAAMDGIKYGDVKTYFYALFDDGSGRFGLMNQDGSPTPVGQALHNLTTLLGDNGSAAGSFAPGSLNYTLSNGGDSSVLMQKSDGTYWLSVWNETAGAHTDTLTLGSTASQIQVFDPLTGTNAVQTASNTGTVTFNVSDSPVLVQIGGATGTSTGGTTTGGTTTGGTTTGGTTGGGTSGGTTTTGNSSTPQPVITVPATASSAAGQTIAIGGVSVSDPWAASHAGTLALNVTTTGGTVTMKDANGNQLAGSGTGAIHVSGTLAQINAELATLSYTAGSGNASVAVDVWDQAGVEATRSIGFSIGSGGTTTSGGTGSTSGAPVPTPTPTPANNNPTINIAANDGNPVELISATNIVASAGDHMIFIGGTNDVVSATGGTETVQAYQGNNRITTGAGNDTIRFAGSNNVINAGSGQNLLADSGTNNTIVLPGANKGSDNIYGYVMTNGDRFDLRPLLATTNWKGDLASIGKFVKLGTSGGNAVISVDASGISGGATYAVATLQGSGPVSLNSLLAHSITS
jgi:hypothetical protein